VGKKTERYFSAIRCWPHRETACPLSIY